MRVRVMPGCCGLRVLHDLTSLGGYDEYSTREADTFDARLKRQCGYYRNCSATVLTLSDEDGWLQKQVEFVTKKGFKLLGQWESNDGDIIYLYGSKEFRMPRGKKK